MVQTTLGAPVEEKVESCSPAAKRVRWDDSVAEMNHDAHKSATNNQVQQPRPSSSANEAIRLLSVGAGTGQNEYSKEYKPEFTHQLFQEERIASYAEGEVSIRVLYSSTSLHFLVKLQTCDNDTARKAEILSRLSKALPSEGDYSTDESEFMHLLEGRQSDFKPPGTRVHEYKRGKKTFGVYCTTGEDPGAHEYHDRAQSLAPWFIETADRIDLKDDRWEVFYLFEEEVPRQVLGEKWRPAAFVGYFTVFGFRNPVKGISLRICQALVLPQYQRQGHGQALLMFLYDVAREREGVFEITVEDPAPGFENLRNLVDARLLRDHKAFRKDLLSPGTFQRPSKEAVQAAHKALKLTVSQVEIGFDILKARDVTVPPITTPSVPTNIDAFSKPEASAEPDSVGMREREEADVMRKPYRLMVKRRLLKRYGEELSADAPVRKRQLDDFYREVEDAFLSLGGKLKKEGVVSQAEVAASK